jgi:hypothetical protein
VHGDRLRDITGQSTRTHKCVRALRALLPCAPVISNVRRHGESLVSAYARNIRAWLLIIAVAMTLIVAALYVSSWFSVLVFALVFALPHVLKRIVCPQCGTPVTYQGNINTLRVTGGFIRTKCQACGWDLRRTIEQGERDVA